MVTPSATSEERSIGVLSWGGALDDPGRRAALTCGSGLNADPRRWTAFPPLGAAPAAGGRSRLRRVPESPLDAHVATPQDLKDRIAAERRGTPFLVYRDGDD